MKILFLDIDGVLNNDLTMENNPSGYVGISDELVEILSMAIDEDTYIVLSSTWKIWWEKDYEKCSPDGKYLIDKLSKYNIKVIDKITDVEDRLFLRGAAILDWLNSHEGITGYAVIDDEYFEFPNYQSILNHFVNTSERFGITEDDAQKVLNILNQKID